MPCSCCFYSDHLGRILGQENFNSPRQNFTYYELVVERLERFRILLQFLSDNIKISIFPRPTLLSIDGFLLSLPYDTLCLAWKVCLTCCRSVYKCQGVSTNGQWDLVHNEQWNLMVGHVRRLFYIDLYKISGKIKPSV